MERASTSDLPFESDVASPRGTAGDPIEEVVYDWDLATDEISWGANLASVTGIADCSRFGTGLGYAEHLAPESPTSRWDVIMASSARDNGGGAPYEAVYALLPAQRSSAAPVWVEDRGRWFAGSRDRPGRAHGSIRIVTQRVGRDRAALTALRDPVTGAFSRTHFVEHLRRHLTVSGRQPKSFAILLVGIDTDDVPQGEADAMLTAAVTRLMAQMRAHEICGRHTATRFAILLEDCNAAQAAAAAARFIAAIERTAPGEATPKARIGAVLAPCHGRSPQALLQFAEETLEAARQPTSPAFLCHDPDTQRAVSQPAVQDELLAALNEGRVILALQPVVEAGSRRAAFHEALVRIRRLDGTLILPESLLRSAERGGIVALIDRRVLDLAFALLSADRRLSLSINASVASLGDHVWIDHLRASSKLRPDAARRLVVEIAETCVIADIEATRAMLLAIKPLGVKIAIDDFGAGQSSFRMLRQLPIDYLKIDGAFAQNLSNSPDDRFFIRTLIDLARNLRVPTVAEWVEDEATARLLTDWGVEYLQGYLFGKAVVPLDASSTRAAG